MKKLKNALYLLSPLFLLVLLVVVLMTSFIGIALVVEA